MSIEVYQYPKCSTCVRALKWLREHDVEHVTRDITQTPPSRQRLADLVKLSGLPVRKWLNVSGQSYRQGGFSEKLPNMSDAQVIDALAADGKLIKRPVVIGKDFVLVGFDAAKYGERLS